MKKFIQRSRGIFFALLLVSVSVRAFRVAAVEILPPGFRPLPPGVHALTGAQVVTSPGHVLTNATIIIRDGFIAAVAPNASIPPDARVWDLKGMTIYAGFIDPYLARDSDKEAKTEKDERGLTGGGINFYGLHKQESETGGLTGPGNEVARVTPERRIAQNYLPDTNALEKLRALGFTTANVVPHKGIICGTSAFVALGDDVANVAIIKPDVFQHIVFDTDHAKENVYPTSLMGDIAAIRQTFFDVQHYALDQADYAAHPSGRKRPGYNLSLEALGPVVQKKMRAVFEPMDALMVDRTTRIARELDIDFYIVSSGQEWRRPDLAKTAAVPFIVPLNFSKLPKLPDDGDWEQVTLDELRAWDWAPENPSVLEKQGLEIALTTYGLDDKSDFRKNLRLALDRGFSESNALAALTTVPARLCGLEKLLGTIEIGKRANLTVVDGNGYFDADAKVRSVWIDGRVYLMPAESKKGKSDKGEMAASETGTNATKKGDAASIAKDKSDSDKKKEEKKLAKTRELQKRIARSPLEGRGVLTNPPAVLVRDATIWTCGPAGRIEHADLFIKDGRIERVGASAASSQMSPGTLVIEGAGLQVTPGLIDCHSHSMILGDVNEPTLPSTAMVRIGDVINSEADNIYEQLAGGLTMAHELHGSANPIGGQNCLIKLRDGETPEGLKFQDCPGSIKFALGENVKQSNWGEKYVTRFPQTRMGVQTFFANRFIAARQYLKAWDDFMKKGGVPPRRDLELETLGEILQGTRLIHCHSYRQDEILMLMRLMESFGVHIGTFQHVLEGYKVADEIARDGAGGSTFADWWAYKFEVYDAIPHNGSLMRDRGVLVSFNSDSGDLARRLYLEAAKAVKYGGTPEIEALKFVTINPARQLRVDARVGSLEPGKDGDFAIWSKAPLDSGTVCLQTWIEGKKYFDRSLAPARATALSEERDKLIAKAKALAEDSGSGEDKGDSNDHSFFKRSLEHLYDGHDRHCLGDSDD